MQVVDTTANARNLDELARPSDIDIDIDRDDHDDDDRSTNDTDGDDDSDDDVGARRPQVNPVSTAPVITRLFEGLFCRDGAMVFVKKGISLTLSRAGSDGDGMTLYKVTELHALDVREPRSGDEGA